MLLAVVLGRSVRRTVRHAGNIARVKARVRETGQDPVDRHPQEGIKGKGLTEGVTPFTSLQGLTNPNYQISGVYLATHSLRKDEACRFGLSTLLTTSTSWTE